MSEKTRELEELGELIRQMGEEAEVRIEEEQRAVQEYANSDFANRKKQGVA